MDRAALDDALLAAHARHDTAELIRLYTLAGDTAEAAADIDAACFYLTHAFVFALESGSVDALHLNKRLVAKGRATPLEAT